jgi:hypothetical protein
MPHLAKDHVIKYKNMLKIKLITAFLYLSIIGYYGSSLGSVPQIIGLCIGFIIGSVPAVLNSLAQILLIVYIIWTAIARPYFKNEKILFITSSIILGANAFMHLLVLGKTPKTLIVYSIITVILFFTSLCFYAYKVFKLNHTVI